MKRTLVASILSIVYLVGMATGVQRTVLSKAAISVQSPEYLLFVPLMSFGLLKGLMDLLGGWLADRVGDRSALMLGLVIYVVGAVNLFLSNTIVKLALSNAFVGSGEGLIYSTSYVALSRKRRGASARLGGMESSVYLGYGSGALMSGFVAAALGLRYAFLISLFSSIASLFISPLVSGVRRGGEEITPTTEVYWRGMRSKTLLVTYFTGHVSKMADSLAWGTYPVFLSALGLSPVEIGITQGVMMTSFALFMPISGRISDIVGRKSLTVVGLIVNILGIAGMLSSTQVIAQMFFSATFGVGLGLYYPVLPAVTADAVPEEARGRALGLYRAMRDLGYASGATFLGIVSSMYGEQSAFLGMIILLGTTLLIDVLLLRETKPVWSTYELHLKHTNLLFRIVCEFREALLSLRSGDLADFERRGVRIKMMEREADQYRREMDRIIYSSVLSGDRQDLLKLASRTDRAISFVLGAFRRISLSRNAIPRELMLRFDDIGDNMVRAALALKESVENMRDYPDISLEHLADLDEAEREFDVLHEELLTIMVEIKTRIDPVDAILLMHFIDFCENSVDLMQDSGDIIRLVISKHSVWSVRG